MDSWLKSTKMWKSAKNGQKMPKRQNGSYTCDCCCPSKTWKKKLFRGGPHCKKSHFWQKKAQKMPFCYPEGSVLQGIGNPTLNSEKFRLFHYNKVVLVLGFLAEIRNTAKNGQKKPKWENGTRTCGCCYPWKNQEEKLFRGGLQSQKSHFRPKNAQKMPFCSPVGSVWQHIANPTPDSEFSEFVTIIKWC